MAIETEMAACPLLHATMKDMTDLNKGKIAHSKVTRWNSRTQRIVPLLPIEEPKQLDFGWSYSAIALEIRPGYCNNYPCNATEH